MTNDHPLLLPLEVSCLRQKRPRGRAWCLNEPLCSRSGCRPVLSQISYVKKGAAVFSRSKGKGGLGPIVNWFVPSPVLSAMMLPRWVWGFFSFYFRQRDGLVNLMQSSLARSEKQ